MQRGSVKEVPSMAVPQAQGWTEAEYLAFERASTSKHEFLAGQVYAMTGASGNHNLITASTIAALIAQSRGSPCRVFSGDMRVRAPLLGNHTYPDVTVACGEIAYTDDTFDTLANPTVVIEVLSPSTESYDRNQKFQNYWRIESLQAYVLIAQDQPRIERFTREGVNTWLLHVAVGLDQTIELPAIGCTLALNEVYAQVTFTATAESQDNEAP
jgi:Uma2 family endonuclease